MKYPLRSARQGRLMMPGVPRDPAAHPLCHFRTVVSDGTDMTRHSTRPCGRVRVEVQRRSTPLVGSSEDVSSAAIEHFIDIDAVCLANTLDTMALTDAQAEAMVSPYISQSIEDVVTALARRLCGAVAAVPWHRPHVRHAWDEDLRFYGEWWLTLRAPDSAACQRAKAGLGATDTEVYTPLLLPDERRVETELQLISDLALRMHGPLYHFELLHIDELALTPDRLHVLIFDGLLNAAAQPSSAVLSVRSKLSSSKSCKQLLLSGRRSRSHRRESSSSSVSSYVGGGAVNEEELYMDETTAALCVADELRTLSFSICQLNSASLLVLFIGLICAAQRGWLIDALDLSYNALSERSLHCLAQLLPRTGLRRLSLRGNRLAGTNTAALRDFLLEGVDVLEELDLSYCELTVVQWSVLIECLPALPRLQVLLLDGMSIPSERMTAFSKAVCHSRLYKISLIGCLPSGATTYVNFIDQACDRHRREHAPVEMRNTFGMTSFFERFFHKSLTKGWLPPHRDGLPKGYRPFTNNDPSLQEDKSKRFAS